MVGEDQPEKFHENSDTSFDNYPLLQVDFSMGKEKYINAGLSAAYDGAEQKPHVEVEFIYDKEHVTYGPYGEAYCVVCDEKQPFSSEYCKLKCTKNWHISWSDT